MCVKFWMVHPNIGRKILIFCDTNIGDAIQLSSSSVLCRLSNAIQWFLSTKITIVAVFRTEPGKSLIVQTFVNVTRRWAKAKVHRFQCLFFTIPTFCRRCMYASVYGAHWLTDYWRFAQRRIGEVSRGGIPSSNMSIFSFLFPKQPGRRLSYI